MTTDESMYAAVERFLGTRARMPRVLALGEALHGDAAFPRLRDELLRGLVAHAGCRCVTLESDCLAGRLVDDHVRGGDGPLDEVMAEGFSHGFGALPANRALVAWLTAHNGTRPPAEQVRFAGFDAPMENSDRSGAHSPRAALRLLHAFLTARGATVPYPWSRIEALLGDDGRWSDPRATMDHAYSVGDTADARELRVITDDLGWLLAAGAPHLGVGAPAEALREAELAARTAAGLLAYHAVLARTDRRERLARCTGIRDAMMAANLDALAAREQGRGPVLAFAHNLHLRRRPTRTRFGDMDVEWSPAGAHLARTHGPGYVVLATAIGSAPHLGIGAPPANTLEGLLAATTSAPRLVTAAELAGLVAEAGELAPRGSEYPSYFPLDPGAPDDYDAVLFLPRLDPPGAAAGATWRPLPRTRSREASRPSA
ncbi:erythromycin esterase family protein [Streptomyces sp. NPDC059142]|uniref:erythromycin esterase family protein n=1 Tax=Streptomyces sp. NPDC059142 TaxID=3346739 RepID=UPI0036AF1218